MSALLRMRLLLVGSAVFTLLGIVMLALGADLVLALGITLFFGACTAVAAVTLHTELLEARGQRPDGRLTTVVLTGSALAFGVACGLILVLAVTQPETFTNPRYPAGTMAVVGAVGTVFFGGGGVALAARAVLARARRR